jgi:serine/threonine-protein kinase RsbW
MPTVEIRFSPLAAHVRTARLMAVAVARRARVDESLLDELRLAVGEACSRAVRLHRQHAPGVPVAMNLSDDEGSFAVEVVDEGPYDAAAVGDDGPELDLRDVALEAPPADDDGLTEAFPPGVVLAVISGLVDTVTITPAEGRGTRVLMRWPAGRSAGDSQTADERDLEYDLPV